jgi:hypothetical protein
MITLEKFQKHIVLYCKGRYNTPKGDKGFFEGLKMIWAIRCGYDYEFTSKDTLTYIANDMYAIIAQCLPHKLPDLMDKLHREINCSLGKPENLTPIEALIWEYRSILQNMQVRRLANENDKLKQKLPGGEYVWLVKLSQPQPTLFNKILAGRGEYNDYKKVK